MSWGWYLTSFVGLHGAVIFWTGLWSLLDHIPGNPYVRDPVFVLLGLFLFALFEAHFGTLARGGDGTDGFHLQFDRQIRWKGRFYASAVSVYVLCASVLTWVGLYNIVERNLVKDSYASQLCFMLCGFGLLVATHSLYYVAGINEPLERASPAVSSADTPANSSAVSIRTDGVDHAQNADSSGKLDAHERLVDGDASPGKDTRSLISRDQGDEDVIGQGDASATRWFYARRLVGLTGEVLIWVATSKFLDRHGFHRTVLRELFYYLCGFAGLTLTSDFFCLMGTVAWSSASADSQISVKPAVAGTTSHARYLCATRPALVKVRAVLSTLSFMLFWTAIDNLLEQDNYLFHRTFWRESAYVAGGLGILLSTDTLGGQSTPFSWSRPTVKPLHPYDAIDSDGL